MTARYSDKELVRMVRGSRTQEEFAILSGIGRPMLSDYERGAVTPSGETWMKIGNLAPFPLNVDCWERGGMPKEIVDFLRTGLGGNAYGKSSEYEEGRDYLKKHGVSPEPVTEGLAGKPHARRRQGENSG